MQEVTNDYNKLLQKMQERWRGKAVWFANQLEMNPSKASRILTGKQNASLEVLSEMAAIVGISVRLESSEMYR